MLRAALEESDNSIQDDSRPTFHPPLLPSFSSTHSAARKHRSSTEQSDSMNILLKQLHANTTNALDVTDLTLFESFVGGDRKRWTIADQSTTQQQQQQQSSRSLRMDSIVQTDNERHMRFFQPSLMSQYNDFTTRTMEATTTTTMTTTNDTKMNASRRPEIEYSIDGELPSELFSNASDGRSNRVFRLFGEVVATKESPNVDPSPTSPSPSPPPPLPSQPPSQANRTDLVYSQNSTSTGFKRKPVVTPITHKVRFDDHQDDCDFLKDFSTDLKQILETPFDKSIVNRSLKSPKKKTPSMPNLSNIEDKHQHMQNCSHLHPISPIKLVDYSSSDNEDNFVKPTKLPPRKTFRVTGKDFTGLFNFDDISTINQSKLQSTFIGQPSSSLQDKTNFPTSSRKPNFIDKDVQSSNAKPQISSSDRKLSMIVDRDDQLNKTTTTSKQPTISNQGVRGEYKMLIDRQKLHLINLKKELLRVQRLERLFAKLTNDKNVRQCQDDEHNDDEDEEEEEEDHILDVAQQKELDAKIRSDLDKEAKFNLGGEIYKFLSEDIQSGSKGNENKENLYASVESLLPSNTSYIDDQMSSSISSISKASYEFSYEDNSRIESILNDSTTADLTLNEMSSSISAASVLCPQVVKMNETFVKSTMQSNNSPMPYDWADDDILNKTTIDNAQSFLPSTTKKPFKMMIDQPSPERIVHHHHHQQQENQLSLEQLFRLRRPHLYEKILKRSARLSVKVKLRRQSQSVRTAEYVRQFQKHQSQSSTTSSPPSPSSPTSLSRSPLAITQARPKMNVKEMRQKTARKYSQLPEVKRRRQEEKKREQIRTNRLMVQIYNAKMQDKLHKKRRPLTFA